jgi:hypothetical protein
MKKTGQDQPPKKTPSEQDLQKLAKIKPRADADTSYQDNKVKGKDGVNKNKIKKA